MALTRDFKETILARVQRDPAFRLALLREALECMLSGDLNAGKAMLRDYIDATQGFGELGRAIDKSPKSLMRMLGPKGNPNAGNMFLILASIQRHEGIRFSVRESARARVKGGSKTKSSARFTKATRERTGRNRPQTQERSTRRVVR